MNVLIVGGTGNISWRLTNAAVEAGWQVTLLNRGGPTAAIRRPAPAGCHIITADMRDAEAVQKTLGSSVFDAVIDFVCYNAPQAQTAIACFKEHTPHYIFISTTAFYDRATATMPLTEKSPMIGEKGWDYALAKAQAEHVFLDAKNRDRFPVTIIRPAHTYDTIIPESVGESDWTNPWRLLNGKPIVVHGDGTTLWTLTHSLDLANGIMEFLKSRHAPGDTFHITTDQTYTWRQITAAVCNEIGVSNPQICYRTTEEIDKIAPRYGNGLKGHKMWCDIYDNTKFKAACPSWRTTVSLESGIKQAVAHFRNHPQLMIPNKKLDAILDSLCALH